MIIEILGKVERQDLGLGTWAFRTNKGELYELLNAPTDLLQTRELVKLRGQIHPDMMTIAMIGPVLEVLSFEAINN